MSIKIEGGDGTAENVIKAGTSNELLYNDKEVLLKENLGLLPPDLSKTQKYELIEVQNGVLVSRPFIVPEDGWIIKVDFIQPATDYIKIDGLGGMGITPCQELLCWVENENGNGLSKPVVTHNINCPYPVKKGQEITHGEVEVPYTYIKFAPCMSV